MVQVANWLPDQQNKNHLRQYIPIQSPLDPENTAVSIKLPTLNKNEPETVTNNFRCRELWATHIQDDGLRPDPPAAHGKHPNLRIAAPVARRCMQRPSNGAEHDNYHRNYTNSRRSHSVPLSLKARRRDMPHPPSHHITLTIELSDWFCCTNLIKNCLRSNRARPGWT